MEKVKMILGKSDFGQVSNLEGYSAAQDQGFVQSFMPGREVIAHREFVFPNMVCDDFIGRKAEGDGIVIHFAHSAHDQSVQLGQFTGPLQVDHHPVDVIEIFIHILDE
jgi:hypothetical protein